MLRLEAINQYYGQSHTLWDIDMHLVEGQCTGLMGRNGVGKTTLLKCIMGELTVDSGAMTYQNQDLTSLPLEMRSRLGIAYVPQGRQIFPLMTVEENMRIGLGARRDGIKQIPEFIYALFPVLQTMLGRRGGDLSGGQQQQLAIARALVLNPELLILDEPTEGIQPNIVSEIAAIIRRLNKELGLTVLLVEQKLPFVRKVADTFYIIDRGRNQASGSVDELSEPWVKEYLSV